MGKSRERSGLSLHHRDKEGSLGEKGVVVSPLGAHRGTSCHTTRRQKENWKNHPTKSREQRQGRGGRRWGVETSSSLSLATVLVGYVGGTRMFMSLGCCRDRDVPSRQRGWQGWLGISSLLASLANRKSSVGCFQASWKRKRSSP